MIAIVHAGLSDRIHRAAHEARLPAIYRRCIDRDLCAGDTAVLLETLDAAARSARGTGRATLAALADELRREKGSL